MDEILEEPRSGRSSIINDKKLEALINSDSYKICQQLVRKLMLTKKLLEVTLACHWNSSKTHQMNSTWSHRGQ